MKLKRFLSLAVSAIMVLAMIPAMTVSAAGTTGVIDALGGEVLWSCPDGNFYDTAIGTAFPGWTSNITSGYVNVRTYSVGNTIQYYVNGTENKTTITSPGYGGNGEDAIVIEWKMKRQTPNDLYFDFSFFDKNGTEIAFLKLDKNFTAANTQNNADYYAMGYPAEGTDCAIVAQNNGDGTHKVDYYVAGNIVATQASLAGEISGFGGIASSNGRWSTKEQHIGFADLTIGAVTYSETRVDVEAQYTVNGEVVHTETGHYDTAEGETGAEFPAYGYSADGSNVLYATDGATLSESGEIALEVVANTGAYSVGDIFAKDGVQYEIKSANLIPNGDFSYGTAGWYNANLTEISEDLFHINNDGTVTMTAEANSSKPAQRLYRTWAIEDGKTYLFTMYVDKTNTYHKVSLSNTAGTSDAAPWVFNGTSTAGTNNAVFTNSGNSLLKVMFRWNNTDKVGNFGLYEIAEAEVAVQETVASVAEIAPVKVIGDTAVVLPSTVSVTGSLGSEVNAPIVWDMPDSYDVGTVTVTGTATVQFGEQDATTVDVSTTVTVLEETFTIADSNSVNNQPGNVVYFPVEITDEFNMEFDYTVNQVKNVSLQLGYNGTIFSSGALGISPNNGVLVVTGGNKAGTSEGVTLVSAVNAGDSFHMFLTADAGDDTYTLTVTTADGTVITTGEKGFRTAHDAINTITLLTNGGGADGDITVSNIKVNANVSKTEYTINTTIDGNTASTTASYWSDEEALASIADLEGYKKDVSIDGTTITVVYSNTKEVTITFVTADETVIYSVTEEVELDESVTVAEKEIYDAVTCAYYTIPETVAETTTVVEVAANANKIAVVADAFHNSSDAQPWNNDANMLFVGSAGVTNTDDTDANGENVTNKTDGGNLGSARVALVKFPVPTVADNTAVKLHLYVAKANQNLGNGNWFKVAANVSGVEANEVENAFVAGDLANLNGIVWSDNAVSAKADPVDGRMDVNEWVEIDVTNFVKAATGDTITFALYVPTAGAYVADREKAVAGGAYEGKAAYLSLEDAFVVTETGFATLTKNGTAMTTAYAVAGDDIRLVADGAVVVNTDAGYYMANENLNLTEATAFENTVPAGLGLAMVGGAQVRIGATELEEGEKLDALADSGLRFLATADYADTVLADDAVEFGIKVTAEASANAAYVKADVFQNDDNNVFSTAITNLAESNYNRKYTAVAYAKVPMADGTTKEFTTDSVTRSIYQVSAGIMKNGTADADNAAYTVDGVVKNILNAYVNQTGIRLTYTADGITVEDGKYTGDVFFTVESVSDGDDGFNVTITPDASWGTPAEIASWWTDYVRVNNNNSVAKGYISANYYVNNEPVFVHDDGTLTFNFDTTDDGTGGFDGEWVSIN